MSTNLPDNFGASISQIPHSFSLYLYNEDIKAFANLHQIPLCYSYFRHFSLTGIWFLHFSVSYRQERKCFLDKFNAIWKINGRKKQLNPLTPHWSLWRASSSSLAKNNFQNATNHEAYKWCWLGNADDIAQQHVGPSIALNRIVSSGALSKLNPT